LQVSLCYWYFYWNEQNNYGLPCGWNFAWWPWCTCA